MLLRYFVTSAAQTTTANSGICKVWGYVNVPNVSHARVE